MRGLVMAQMLAISLIRCKVFGFGFSVRPLSRLKSSSSTLTQQYATLETKISTSSKAFSQTHDQRILPSHVRKWLDIELPEGRCVGVAMSEPSEEILPQDLMTEEAISSNSNHWAHSHYHPEEVAHGLGLPPAISTSFWTGRLAMRMALQYPDYPILKDSHGRPLLHDHDGQSSRWLGSISHKHNFAVALVSNDPVIAGVGIDLERNEHPSKRSIGLRILTERERDTLGLITGITEEEEVLLRFSLKESIYKAIHPVLSQYVGFQEVEAQPYADGTAHCTINLESGGESALSSVTARWRKVCDNNEVFFLTSATSQRAT